MRHQFKLMNIRFDAMERRIDQLATKEELEATETRLLSEFWKWGRTAEIKLKALPLMEQRLSAVESRMFDAEENIRDLRHPKAS